MLYHIILILSYHI